MVINEESKQRKFIQYIAPECSVLKASTACPSRQRSSWSGRRCLAECPTKLCRLSTPRIGGDYSKCTLNSWAISVMLWFLNIWSHIEESVISTFLLLGFLFRLCINLLQILDNLLSCLKEQGSDISYKLGQMGQQFWEGFSLSSPLVPCYWKLCPGQSSSWSCTSCAELPPLPWNLDLEGIHGSEKNASYFQDVEKKLCLYLTLHS